MFQSKAMKTICGLAVAAALMAGCSSESAQNTCDPYDLGSVYVTPDDTGLLQYSLSASDCLGRTVYRQQFTQAAVVSIQVTEPSMQLASATPEPEAPTVASVDTDYIEP